MRPPDLESLWQWWASHRFKNLELKYWWTCFYAVLWTIWIGRNDRVFNKGEWDDELMLDMVMTRMALWIKGKCNIKNYSVDDFKRCLDGIRRLRL